MIKYFQKAISLALILLVSFSYNSYANNLDDGIDNFQKQEYKKAVELLNKYVDENPDDPEPHKWLAKCYNELFMLDLSLKELDKVKKLEEKRSYINKKEKIKNESIDIIKEPEIVEQNLDKSSPKIIIINPKKKTSVNNFYLGKKKIRIAVLDFKYKSSSYYKNDITQSFTEYITSKLINSNIKIAERSQIDEVIKELKFENSEYVLSSTAKKIGNIYGIDYLLLGYVLDFSSETKSAYQKKQTIYKKIYFSRISFKLVNISTGELEVSDVISDSYQDSNNYYESTSNSEIEEYLISSISKKINNIIIEKLNSKFYKSKK